eukprot:TRINITY_DN4037_c0_g1_i1.p1 TRINITY_DN4037_c0_g1~~TRINITY_DN4037_c0_g1_i1.p1  ORF type:complete len:221 (+),score=27.67 TRINITY_DN4037_c0_g1_i1:298-960(+)
MPLKIPKFSYENDAKAKAFQARYDQQRHSRQSLSAVLPDDALQRYISEFKAAQQKDPNMSGSTLSEVVLPRYCAQSGLVLSGHLMKFMDTGAGVAAYRRTRDIGGKSVVTACVQSIDFRAKAKSGDWLTVISKVIFASTKSMIILTMILRKSIGGKLAERLVARGTYTFLALDKEQKPLPAPPVTPETDLDKSLYNFGQELYNQSKADKKEKVPTAWPLV